MKWFRVIAVAFSLYSRIPMPRFDWEDEDMRYSIAAFPWVGAVCGLFFYAVFHFGRLLEVPDIALALLMAAVPLVLTGGFHVDGYMDTKDALNSYKPREEKLEILKDPRTGAFAVIWLGIAGLLYVAMLLILLSSPEAEAVMAVMGTGFFLARCQSAVDVILMTPARKGGMLYHESGEAKKARTVNLVLLCIWTGLVLAGMFLLHVRTAVILILVTIFWNLLYYRRCKKQFGGITGDTAGYFVVKCELYYAVGAVIVQLVLKAAGLA